MRATWKTSVLAGFIFGVAATLLDPGTPGVRTYLLMALFFVSTFAGVIGWGQMREMMETRKARGLGFFGVMAEKEDFQRIYLPIWGRLAVWFFATAAAAVTTKIL